MAWLAALMPSIFGAGTAATVGGAQALAAGAVATEATAATVGTMAAGASVAGGAAAGMTAAEAAMLGSTILTTGASVYSGVKGKKAADKQAGQLEEQASQQRVRAGLAAAEERRKGRYLSSRARAVAAASGGGVADPSVVNTIAGIEADSEINALMTLYNGDQLARESEINAGVARAEGRAMRTTGFLKGGSSILGGAYESGFFDKYARQYAK